VGPQRVRIGASQMFPWKGTLKAREDVVLTMAKSKFERIEATKLNLFFQVKQAYFQIYDLDKSQVIIQRNIRIFQALERFALSKVTSGKGSSADVLRIQLKIQELEKELEILDNQKNKPLAVINQILNRPLDTSVSILDSLSLAVIPFNKDTLASNIMDNHPMVNLYSTQQEASRKAIELNELQGKPSFGVGLDYIMVGKRNNTEISGNGRDILMPRALVKIPLYRKKYGAKEREEKLKIAALENQKKDVQSKFLSAIDQAYADQEDAVIRINLYEELKETTQAAIDILQTDYSTAGRSFDELLRLQIDLVNYDLKILKAVVKSHIAKAVIERFII
jgi:outer membrane protein TolC